MLALAGEVLALAGEVLACAIVRALGVLARVPARATEVGF